MTLPADEQFKWLEAAYGDARTTIADRDAEIERLNAQIAEMGTVTDDDVEQALDTFCCTGQRIVLDSTPRPLMSFQSSLRRIRAALEAFAKTKGGGARSQPLDQNSNQAPQSRDQACGAESDGLCEGCPPVGYPTDKTRCLPCPRREAFAKTKGGDATSKCPTCGGLGCIDTDTGGNFHQGPCPSCTKRARGADLHGRGKFGGPLAEQYVEQADGAESDAAFVERFQRERNHWMSDEDADRLAFLAFLGALAPNEPDPRDAQIAKLIAAADQCLDDMGKDGLCVCGQAKAELRVAMEPFLDEERRGPLPFEYDLVDAARVLEETGGES